MERILECVPNFSEGRDMDVIRRIAAAVTGVEGTRLLHTDPGRAANRTVLTFAGRPESVVESAFRAVREAAVLIDMRRHYGEHPRIGATDVLPLVPVRGVTLEEAAALARSLARRISDELGIPTYAYEAAATCPARRDLAYCRKGEYEGLSAKMRTEDGCPDFGPREFTDMAARAGATVVGARNFLIAVNFNLDTSSVDVATDIALDVRQRGRAVRIGDPLRGQIMRDDCGHAVTIPGTLKGTKAIGWFIEEYGFAQVSMNIVDIAAAPLHKVFEEVCRVARLKGARVTGTEIIGLVPLGVLTDAGRYFLAQSGRRTDVADGDLVAEAVETMGLGSIAPFVPQERIIDYML